MTPDLAAPERDQLRRLLLAWQSGALTFHQAVEEAEAIEDRVWPDVEVIAFPAGDPRTIPTEIVSILSMGYAEPLFVEDIPHLLACLDTPNGTEVEALKRLSAYFDSLNHDERLHRAEQVYSQQEPPDV